MNPAAGMVRISSARSFTNGGNAGNWRVRAGLGGSRRGGLGNEDEMSRTFDQTARAGGLWGAHLGAGAQRPAYGRPRYVQVGAAIFYCRSATTGSKRNEGEQTRAPI